MYFSTITKWPKRCYHKAKAARWAGRGEFVGVICHFSVADAHSGAVTTGRDLVVLLLPGLVGPVRSGEGIGWGRVAPWPSACSFTSVLLLKNKAAPEQNLAHTKCMQRGCRR